MCPAIRREGSTFHGRVTGRVVATERPRHSAGWIALSRGGAAAGGVLCWVASTVGVVRFLFQIFPHLPPHLPFLCRERTQSAELPWQTLFTLWPLPLPCLRTPPPQGQACNLPAACLRAQGRTTRSVCETARPSGIAGMKDRHRARGAADSFSSGRQLVPPQRAKTC